MLDKTLITLFILLCVTILEIAALFNGIDGIVLTSVIGLLAAIGGYKYGSSSN